MTLIAGAGAIGGWLAAYVDDPVLLGRQPLIDAIAADGLHIRGHTTHTKSVPAVTTPDGLHDTIIITCKAHQTAEMAALVAPHLTPGGLLISLQNGLGNAEVLANHFDRVGIALTNHGVRVEAPGKLHHAGRGTVKVGGKEADATARVLRRLGPAVVDPVRGHIWLKAIVNAGLNPIAALHGIPNGKLLAHEDQAKIIVDECVALSRAAGVALPGDPWQAWQETVAATAENRCSMLQDFDAKRPSEIEQITGHFVRLARRLGFPLFANEDLLRAVLAHEEQYLGDRVWQRTKAAVAAFDASA